MSLLLLNIHLGFIYKNINIFAVKFFSKKVYMIGQNLQKTNKLRCLIKEKSYLSSCFSLAVLIIFSLKVWSDSSL